MGHLRLLYCDSAGLRRCRVVVCDGPIPGGPALLTAPGAQAAAEAAAAGCVEQQQSLEVTPSIALAAAAGVLPAPSGRGAQGSLRGVAEDRVLSPEHTEQQQEEAACRQQQPDQQQQQPAAAAEPQEAPAQSTLTQLGSFSTPGGLKPSPSMILAAAAGAIATPPGAELPRYNSSNSSLEDYAAPRTLTPHNSLAVLQPGAATGAAAGAAGPVAPTASGGGALLEPTPSMALAAAAGAITREGATGGATGGSGGSSRNQSPSRLAAMSSAGPLGGSPLRPPQQGGLGLQTGAQRSGANNSSNKPRPLISAFIKSPLGVLGGSSGSLLGAAGGSAAALALAAKYSVGLVKSCMAQPAFADVVCEGSGLAPVEEVLLVPDLTAAVPWHRQGDMMAPVDMWEKDLSQPWSCCPRTALKRALQSLELRHGLSLLAGFELEFVLLRPAPLELLKAFPEAAAGAHLMLSGGQAWVPLDSTIYCQTVALSHSTTELLQEIVQALEDVGIGVIQYHAEAGPGQFELALAAFPALQAADKLLLAREVIWGVVSKAGLAVTWLPKPFPNQAGSGCHVHFSLWRGGNCIMADTAGAAAAGAASQLPPGAHPLSVTANSFLAGVLEHLPALLTFTAPSVNSYERLKPGCWSGAFVCWGFDNREAPLRVCCPRTGPQAMNAEYKSFDGSTNPYLGLAALVAAGMLGLEEGSRLPAAVQVDPGAASNAGAAAELKRMPSSLPDALKAWAADSKLQGAVQSVLGADLVKAFMAVRRCEAETPTRTEDMLLRY